MLLYMTRLLFRVDAHVNRGGEVSRSLRLTLSQRGRYRLVPANVVIDTETGEGAYLCRQGFRELTGFPTPRGKTVRFNVKWL
jgi:hypothetical protein